MNKDEIKKGLTVCAGDSCDNCSYYKFHNCYDRLKLDARELIIKQEQEIEQLEEQIEELRNEKWDAQDDLDCYYYDEMPSKIKQAKIEVLNELKDKMFEREYMGVKYKERIFYESEINDMIADVQNAEDKSRNKGKGNARRSVKNGNENLSNQREPCKMCKERKQF